MRFEEMQLHLLTTCVDVKLTLLQFVVPHLVRLLSGLCKNKFQGDTGSKTTEERMGKKGVLVVHTLLFPLMRGSVSLQ